MKLDFDKEYDLKITIDQAEKLQLLSEFSKVNNTFEPMQKWFDDPQVPQPEKEKHKDKLLKALKTMSEIYNLLKACQISNEEIMEYAKLPF